MLLTIKEPTSQNTRLCQKSAIQTGELSASFNNFPNSEHWRGTILVKNWQKRVEGFILSCYDSKSFWNFDWLCVFLGLGFNYPIFNNLLLAWQCFPKISTRPHSISFLTLTGLNAVYAINCYQRFINLGVYSYVLW